MDDGLALKPCPFCGSHEIAVVDTVVRCGICSAAGPYGFSSAEAVERWNARVEIMPRRKTFAADAGQNPGAPYEP